MLGNLRLTSVVAATGLGQAAADQITDSQQGDQEPALVGTERLSVRIDVDHQGGDQNTEYRKYVHNQFGRLKRGLGLSAETVIAVSSCDGSAAADQLIMVGGAGGHDSPVGRLWFVGD